ncbi:MAG: tetratricopeptide repeat protein [Acidobacteria bacterium]|nr:MAG: tetratricopeptide repeat protein [Acidobacteriota bacterium]RPJ85463.1 MAG: tetratricopeptide repeat protein [Acidobacteriota bacterium]
MDRMLVSPAAVLRHLAVAASLALVATAGAAQTQVDNVKGVVRSADGKAIKGATVIAESTRNPADRLTAATDDRGRFVFKRLRRGVWSFVAVAQGYMEQQDVCDIGLVKSLEFELDQTPAGPPGLKNVAGRVIQADLQETTAMMDRGEYDRAIEAYQAMLTNVPTLTTVNLLIGDAHLAKKDYEGAIAAYRRLLETEPAHEGATIALARVYVRRGQPAPAEILLAGAAGSGASGEIHYELGKVRLELGNDAAAQQDFQKAASLAPTWAKPVYELALIANQRGDRLTAARQLEQVIALDPESAEAADARRLLSEMKR